MKRINITCPACGSRAYLRPASVVYGDKAPDPDAKYYVCGRYQRGPHPGGTAADHCGVSYAVLTCFLYILRGGCRFSVSSPYLHIRM